MLIEYIQLLIGVVRCKCYHWQNTFNPNLGRWLWRTWKWPTWAATPWKLSNFKRRLNNKSARTTLRKNIQELYHLFILFGKKTFINDTWLKMNSPLMYSLVENVKCYLHLSVMYNALYHLMVAYEHAPLRSINKESLMLVTLETNGY